MSSAGDFKINVWRGGYPVWCEISYMGIQLAKIRHSELSDLKYAVEKAMQECISELPISDRHEV